MKVKSSLNLQKLVALILCLAILALAVISYSKRQQATTSPHIVMGYWVYSESSPMPGSLNKQGQVLKNQDLQDKLNYLNILAYAFLNVDSNGVVHFNNSYVDLADEDFGFCKAHPEICSGTKSSYQAKLGNFRSFAKLSNQAKTLKKIISIGGADDDQSFNYAIHHIPAFVDSVAIIINSYQLNGVDLDFEPDEFTAADAQGYVGLVAALRQKLGPDELITLAISTNQKLPEAAWKSLAENANYISDMCYDFHSAFYSPHYTGYNSNIYPDSNEPMIPGYYHLSCDQSIRVLTFHGVPPEKIILGYPSYAEIFNGVPAKNKGLFQAFDANKKLLRPDNSALSGVSYQKVINFLNNGFTEYMSTVNGKVSGIWAYNPKTQQFLSYDNVAAVKEKVNYVNKNHLAGLMTWQINFDVPVASSKSLLKAANTGNN